MLDFMKMAQRVISAKHPMLTVTGYEPYLYGNYLVKAEAERSFNTVNVMVGIHKFFVKFHEMGNKSLTLYSDKECSNSVKNVLSKVVKPISDKILITKHIKKSFVISLDGRVIGTL